MTAGAGVFALALMAALASAHTTMVSHGSDNARMFEAHRRGLVFDGECDNHIVYGKFRGANGQLYVRSDQDGCAGSGTPYTFPTRIVRYQVCEETAGCSEIIAT